MFFTVIAIFALSVIGVASEHLFQVDIAIPQKEGRKEIEDIEFIQSTLTGLTGIKTIFARKAFDNRNVLLVLDVQELCQWSTLTSDLSEQGYELTVSPLQNCTNTASEFGVESLFYHRLDEIQEADVLEYFVVKFYDEGMNTDEYVAKIKKHFEMDKIAMEENFKSLCFRQTGELPVKLMYFGAFATSELKDVYQKARNGAKASITMDLLQKFDSYTKKC